MFHFYRISQEAGFIGCRLCGSIRRNVSLDISQHCLKSHKMTLEDYIGRFGQEAVRRTEQEKEISK